MKMDKLIELRKRRGWTQQDLADKCGVSRNSIVNWENGRSEPRFIDIEKMASVLEILPDELLEKQSIKKLEQNELDSYPTMSYWGGVIDNIRKVLLHGDLYEVMMIESLLKSGYELLTQAIGNNNDINSHININATNNFGSRQVVVSA